MLNNSVRPRLTIKVLWASTNIYTSDLSRHHHQSEAALHLPSYRVPHALALPAFLQLFSNFTAGRSGAVCILLASTHDGISSPKQIHSLGLVLGTGMERISAPAASQEANHRPIRHHMTLCLHDQSTWMCFLHLLHAGMFVEEEWSQIGKGCTFCGVCMLCRSLLLLL